MGFCCNCSPARFLVHCGHCRARLPEGHFRALLETETARQQAFEANAAKSATEANTKQMQQEMKELRLELDGARQREPLRVVQRALRAVAATAGILPESFVPEEDAKTLAFLRTHDSRADDALILNACHLCQAYLCTGHELTSSKVDVEHAMTSSSDEAMQEATQRRDDARAKQLLAAQELLGACAKEPGLVARAVERNQSVKTSVRQLVDFIGESTDGIEADADLSSADIVSNSLSSHDAWVSGKILEAKQGREKVQEAMVTVATTFRAYSAALLCSDYQNLDLSDLHDTRRQTGDLLEHIADLDAWVAGLARDYEQSMAQVLRRAAWVAIAELREESLRLDALVRATASAKNVVEDGRGADRRVIAELTDLSKKIMKARRAVDAAQRSVAGAQQLIEDAEDDNDDDARADAEQELIEAKNRLKTHSLDVIHLQEKQRELWREVYRLAAEAYPELPARALSCSSRNNDVTLSLVDPRAARLLAPARHKEMYSGPNGTERLQAISLAGQDSRNDVFHAAYAGVDVCLKRFVLGRVGSGSADPSLRSAVRTLQRELNSIVKMAHDRILAPNLFFMQADDDGRLCAYVEYPWYPCGSMDKWIGSLPAPEGADALRIRIVLWDVIKALEHVHYHGVVHCDVKLANVLVELHDGQHRGVLADFDLSKDLEARKLASVSKCSTLSGARGTLGGLTMAPEVFEGRQPTFQSDVFSFGGMCLQALFSKHADVWRQGGDHDRWDAVSGDPLLEGLEDDASRNMLSLVLQRDAAKRPPAARVVSHSFFSNDRRALDLLQALEQQREDVERKGADFSARVFEHQHRMRQDLEEMAVARNALQEDFRRRQAELDQKRENLEQQRGELVKAGQHNQDVQEKLDAEETRLQADREKMMLEKMKREEDLQQREREHAEKKRDEEARLASERKKIEERKAELAQEEKDPAVAVRVPVYWENRAGFHRVSNTSLQDALQKFMAASSACSCKDACLTQNAQVLSVERVENESLWQMYQTKRKVLQKTLAQYSSSMRRLRDRVAWQPDACGTAELVDDVNEFYLFHGTSSTKAAIIAEHGLDERVANLRGLYGAGSYFACNACKSHQYAAANKDSADLVMLVCRVSMGIPYCTAAQHGNARRAPDNPATPGRPFDSIFAEHGIANSGKQHHNEFVVFDMSQVYPEFIVRYRV